MLPNSARTSTGPIGDFEISGRFSSQILATNVERVTKEYNDRQSEQEVSTTAAAYAVTLMTLGPEMLIPIGAPSNDEFCHFGSAAENVRLFTVYDA
jgi:hypothetical protein